MNIELDSLVLTRYSEEKHKRLKENFESGESHSDFIYQIGSRLENSKNNNRSIYQSAFVVEDLGVPVGYLFISNRIRDEVFLEYAVLKEYRGMGYGSDIVRQTTDYLFQNHNIKDIRLDIDPSNKNSINTAEACGYTLDEDEFASRNYTGRMQFVQDSTYYVSKRR
ncbi:MAG: GNAT family N-acetyltransferase [bacterium]|nr:GNAT family N-acetyltransferase [Mycoplasmatota bacterium]MDD6757010.1 GNAT family N-acetyltransferase [bacterium]MDY2908232.1 GNAT family N-acetyltransferase [Candidatus Faecimonas sp.]